MVAQLKFAASARSARSGNALLSSDFIAALPLDADRFDFDAALRLPPLSARVLRPRLCCCRVTHSRQRAVQRRHGRLSVHFAFAA